MKKIVFNGTESEFFAALSQKTESYENQSFFVPLDNKIICKRSGSAFRLWMRSRGPYMVVDGYATQDKSRASVVWEDRLPAFAWIAYGAMLCATLFAAQPMAFVVVAVGLAGWLLVLKFLVGRPQLEQIEQMLQNLKA